MKQLIFLGLILLGQYSLGQTLTTSTTGVNQPAAPAYEVCTRTIQEFDSEAQSYVSRTITDQDCEIRNQAKEQKYNMDMAAYNQAMQIQQQNQAQAAAVEQQRLAQQAQINSAKAAAEKAQKKNEEGSIIFQLASVGCTITSSVYAAQFAASCGYRGCSDWPALYKSVAFAALAVLANTQANSHDQVAFDACKVAGQMASAGGGGCGGPPPVYNPGTYPQPTPGGTGVTSLFDANGKCIGNKADCDTVTRNLPPGVKIPDGIKGLSTFASSANKPFTIDKDGKIITRDGKKIDPNSLTTEEGLMKLGMSAADAKGFLASINAMNSSSSLAKGAAKDMKSPFESSFGDSTVGGAGGPNAKGNGANGAARGEKDIGGGKRGLASAEGLAKDFNGEMIGVAGDDIFKMMNRRYKLKTSQDNFIAP